MAKDTVQEPDTRRVIPTPRLAFIVGLFLFAMILCPAGVLFSNIMHLNIKLGIYIYQSLALGCVMGLIVALIPAFFFMRATIKRLKKK